MRLGGRMLACTSAAALAACGAPSSRRGAGGLGAQEEALWSARNSLATPRSNHTATLLPDGRVLVAGGISGAAVTASAELYVPSVGGWRSAQPMNAARQAHTATLLPDGTVLVAGGFSALTGTAGALGTAEIYDPVADRWTLTPALTTARAWHTATRLANGKVLLVGGCTTVVAGATCGNRAAYITGSAEVYDPSAGTWTATTALPASTERAQHTATLMPNGTVLVAGGANNSSNSQFTVYLYDPVAATWTATGSFVAPPDASTGFRGRYFHTASLLPTGDVLVAGGVGDVDVFKSVELYVHALGSWTSPAASEMSVVHYSHAATLLPDGLVLVEGGSSSTGTTNAAELFDPSSATWSAAGTLPSAVKSLSATLLPGATVLAAGGYDGTASVSGRTSYSYSAGAFSPAPGMSARRSSATATLLTDGTVLWAGGPGAAGSTAERFDPSSGTWLTPMTMLASHSGHTATLLFDGSVLVAGGAPADTSELYAAGCGGWQLTGAVMMGTPRTDHSATLLADGRVLVAGGYLNGSPGQPTATTQLYDPGARAWSSGGALVTARFLHSATLLTSGKVLLTGGTSDGFSALPPSAELYDPASSTSSLTGVPDAGRFEHSATLLPGGRVLVAGGKDSTGTALASAELYDPGSGTWRQTNYPMPVARAAHAASLLVNGAVLIEGGVGPGGVYLDGGVVFDPASQSWTDLASPLGEAKANARAVVLFDGRVLVGGGETPTGPTASSDFYDEGRGAAAAVAPTLAGPLPATLPGGALSLSGSLFEGISEASGGGFQSSATNFPMLELVRSDEGPSSYATVTGATTNAGKVVLPASLLPGPYWARVVVNGVPSRGQALFVGDAGAAAVCADGGGPNLDAGSSDAGAPDAGAPDAGPGDAGLADAGSADAGAVDAGGSDAGLADAGLADAGAADAGGSDAGQLDAGAADAGAPGDAGRTDAGASADAGESDAGTSSSLSELGFHARCGCDGGPGELSAVALAALAWLGRRRGSRTRKVSRSRASTTVADA